MPVFPINGKDGIGHAGGQSGFAFEVGGQVGPGMTALKCFAQGQFGLGQVFRDKQILQTDLRPGRQPLFKYALRLEAGRHDRALPGNHQDAVAFGQVVKIGFGMNPGYFL